MSLINRLHFIIILGALSITTIASADDIAHLEREVGENKIQVSLAYNKYLAAKKKFETSQNKLAEAKKTQAMLNTPKRFNKNR